MRTPVSSTPSTPVSATAARSALARHPYRAQGPDRPRRDGGDRPHLGPPSASLRGHHGRRRGVRGRKRTCLRRARAARDCLPGGLSARIRRRRCGCTRRSSSTRDPRSTGARAGRRLASRAVLLLDRGLRRLPRPRRPGDTHFNESQDELDWLERGVGPMRPVAEFLIEPDGQTGIRRLAEAGSSTAALSPPTASSWPTTSSASSPGTTSQSRTARRSNALLGCGIAPLPELRAAGLRVGIGTDGVSSVSSTTSSRSSGRSSRRRGRARSGPTRSRRARRSNWRRSAARARSGSPGRRAPSSPASARI